MSTPSPAWFPDPENPNQLRWWDGSQWTPATAPLPVAPTAIAVPPSTTPAKKRTGWRTAGIIVGALVVGGFLARLSPVAILLAALAVVAVALVVMIARPLPALGLSTRRSGLAALGVAALLVMGGGVASASMVANDSPTASRPHTLVDTTSTPTAKPTPKPSPTTFETVTEESVIPFAQTTIDDPQREQGTTGIVTAGVDGVKVLTYRVTKVNGVETSRELVNEVVQTPAVDEVTAIGSKAPAPAAPVPLIQQGGGCDPNYTGACVPIASDVDCAGGSGNGPAYVQGPVRIVGSDIYDLDRDGDGIACD
ncbi:G5 domain-containing protein [Streptomyces sp. AC495_CC817]|uniref:G5 domain-containing protein n=1 Tax=Streptomyces sp. AC495_CC817 TaxID=2823900 RepID=UPI001C254478|nr:G5 domain-containing protein [Streptomyces sp. AC495_CC817]